MNYQDKASRQLDAVGWLEPIVLGQQIGKWLRRRQTADKLTPEQMDKLSFDIGRYMQLQCFAAKCAELEAELQK